MRWASARRCRRSPRMRLLLRAGQVRRVLLVCPKPLIPNWQREFKMWAEEMPVTVDRRGRPTRRKADCWTMPGDADAASAQLLKLTLRPRLTPSVPRDGESSCRSSISSCSTKPSGSRTATRCTAERPAAIPRKRSWASPARRSRTARKNWHRCSSSWRSSRRAARPTCGSCSRSAKNYVLRRTKDLVMTDLPPRLDRDEIIELSPAQQIAYEHGRERRRHPPQRTGRVDPIQHVFELVLRLKQITNFDPLTGESRRSSNGSHADMEEIAACGGKAILFSQWTKTHRLARTQRLSDRQSARSITAASRRKSASRSSRSSRTTRSRTCC